MKPAYHLFDCFGVELEYMIVRRDTLDVFPAADRVLHAVAGAYDSEVEIGEIAWSNELALHVIELKTSGPASALTGLAAKFQDSVRRINAILAEHDAMLMPGAMHPWMDPYRETRLWPHEYSPVYESFNRIFDCRGHGWSNLQSAHLNLPFGTDEEFGRLHAAIRLLMPILPALAASSPIMDGRVTGLLDTRLETYRQNSRKVPTISGQVIPEPVFCRADYEREILHRIYRDLAAYDPEGILRFEWANARGAIARFDRSAIEIRTLDVQECPLADLTLIEMIVAALRGLVEERWCSYETQKQWDTTWLADLHLRVIRDGAGARINSRAYADCFAAPPDPDATVAELWRHLSSLDPASGDAEARRILIDEGCLSRRILKAVGGAPDRGALDRVYRRLCDALAEGSMFHG